MDAVHLSWINMNAFEKVKSDYTLEEFKEIANHGCQSGVCTKHIYYGDTIRFYETFETDIVTYLRDEFSTEFLVDTFRTADADLTIYKNHLCWAFIEAVAFQVVEDHNFEYAQANADALAPLPFWFSH